MRFLFLSILFSIFIGESIYAQKTIDGFSISSSVGVHSGLRKNSGAIVGMKFNLFSDDKVFSIRYNKIEEIPPLFSTYYPHEDFHEISTLYGGFDRYKRSRIEYQVGISILWGIARGDRIYPESNYKWLSFSLSSSERFERDDFVTIGIPLHIGFKVFSNDIFSIGLDLDANANLKSSYISLGLCVEFGWMPNVAKPQE